MKTILCLLVLCSATAARASAKETPRGAWLEGAKWTNAPPDINRHLQSAQVAILYFDKDHKFALIYCTVNRIPKQYVTISNGDPRGVYQGEWKANQHGISVTYRLVEATILQQGQQLPGPMQRATIEISQDSTMLLEGETFRRGVALDKSATEAVYGVGQTEQKQASTQDGKSRNAR